MNKKLKETLVKILCGLASFLIFGLIWQFFVSFTMVGYFMPGPIETLQSFFNHLVVKIGPGTLLYHVWCSLKRVIPAYIVASAFGITLGLLMAMYKPVDAIVKPIFNLIRPIPPVAWIPLAILWFGINDESKYFLIGLATFVSVVQNAYAGAKVADKQLIGVAKMLGANDRKVFLTVILPNAVPYIFAGLQLGLSSAWAQVVGSEMIRSVNGIGWVIIRGTDNNNILQELIGIIMIGIFGYILAAAMRFAEGKLCRWNQRGI